jgi:hypothetical protein
VGYRSVEHYESNIRPLSVVWGHQSKVSGSRESRLSEIDHAETEYYRERATRLLTLALKAREDDCVTIAEQLTIRAECLDEAIIEAE